MTSSTTVIPQGVSGVAVNLKVAVPLDNSARLGSYVGLGMVWSENIPPPGDSQSKVA